MRRRHPQFDNMQEETVQPQPAENSGKPLEQQLAEAQAQVQSQREAMLRALADAENARKRYQAEAANSQKYAIERFAEALLPVVDSLEAALANKDASPDALRDGVQLTLRQLTQAETYLSPLGPEAEATLDEHWLRLTGREPGAPVPLRINDREVRAKAVADGVAWFEFVEVCEGPRSAADYIELARDFHTVLLSNVPRLGPESGVGVGYNVTSVVLASILVM